MVSNNSYVGNPIIKHKFTADPTVIFEGGRFYVYCGRDEAPSGTHDYLMKEWLCFSSNDFVNWSEHNVSFSPQTFTWGKSNAYASKVVSHRGKFYWFVALTPHESDRKAIGVAISDSPTGPFHDAIGSPLILNQSQQFADADNFDPSVIIDDDGSAYIFWGKNVCMYAPLDSSLLKIVGDVKTIELPDFMEGIHIHKRNAWYYLSYGFGFPEKVGYAMSRSVHGPWEFKGILNEVAGNCETNRPAILDMPDRSYFFYHNGMLREGGSHRRSVCVDYLYYNSDGTMKRVIMTSEGVLALR